MINVIKEIMFDCAYENVVQTEITFEEKVYNLNIFKHREVESQIFIVLQILESQLVAQDNYKDLVIEIANYFRENDIYVPDMDKNTSLIYCVKRDIKSNKLDELKVKIEDEVTDVICEQCGRNMVVKYGPHGKFLACPGFPECRNTKPYLEKIGVPCPECGKDIVVRKTKKGRRFYGCENHPECDFVSWQKPVAEKCPKCGSYMVQKGNKIVCANQECRYVLQ